MRRSVGSWRRRWGCRMSDITAKKAKELRRDFERGFFELEGAGIDPDELEALIRSAEKASQLRKKLKDCIIAGRALVYESREDVGTPEALDRMDDAMDSAERVISGVPYVQDS